MKAFYYYCINRGCREFHVEFAANLSPLEVREACGRCCCHACEQPLRLLRVEKAAA